MLTRVTVCLASFAAVVAMTACTSLDTSLSPDKVTLRATERWRALIAGEFENAYAYNTASFRAVVSPASYRGRTGAAVKWMGAEVTSVVCAEATTCKVNVRLDFQPLLGGRGGSSYSTYLDESWLFEDGQWWIHQPVNQN
jgi:hypothetical protein